MSSCLETVQQRCNVMQPNLLKGFHVDIQVGLQDGSDPLQLTVYQRLGYQDGKEKDAEQL